MVSNPLTSLFGQSPFKPIQEHIVIAHSCALELRDFFTAVLADDWQKAEAIRDSIAESEDSADDLKKQIRLNLPKSLFLPVPRSDLLELITMQDKIANISQDVAGLMLGRQMKIPDSMAKDMQDYVQLAIDTSAQAVRSIQEIDELLETGFSGKEVEVVQGLIEELDQLEHRNDLCQVQIRAQLFKLESELPPVDVIFLYKIIDWIGDIADCAQRVGSRLQILIAR